MPKKVRELKAMLTKAGFLWRPGKGAHTVWYHSIVKGVSVALCGHDGDDAPPYFTMLIVGHFIVGGVLALEKGLAPPTWVQLAIWLPMTLIASLLLLPRVKGALVGLQWALYMHGFEPAQPPSEKPML